jgi:hypothetical protein
MEAETVACSPASTLGRLPRAVADWVIAAELGSELIEIASTLFYEERMWSIILGRHAHARRLPAN